MATLSRSHKIRLTPTPEQEEYFRRAAGVRRFVYNWGLQTWQEQYAQYKAGQRNKAPTANSLKKDFNAIRHQQFPFTEEVTKCVIEGAFDDLGKAFSHFFLKRAKYPKWKKKQKSRDSFYLSNDKFDFGDHWVQVPKLGDFVVGQRELHGEPITKRGNRKKALGKVNLSENFRYVTEHTPTEQEKPRHTRKYILSPHVKILGATIGREADWWFISIQVELELDFSPVTGSAVGIDLGFIRLATLSDGKEFENQKPLRHLLQQQRFLNKQLARREKGSKNWHKTKLKVARLHYRITCIREDSLHKISYELAETYGFMGMEDLNGAGMMRNHKRALSAVDASLGKLARYIQTKATRHGTIVQRVGRFFPSTKMCHKCGHLWHDITEKDRVYVCQNPECRWSGDRDWNAAITILIEALRLAWLSERISDEFTVSAVAGTGLDGDAKLSLWRQRKTG